RRKLATAPRPYRLPGYPLVPLIFLLVMVWIVVSALIRNPKESIATVLLILLGLPLYPLFRGRRLLYAGAVVPPQRHSSSQSVRGDPRSSQHPRPASRTRRFSRTRSPSPLLMRTLTSVAS